MTPNHEHFRPAKLFLERGFNVVCDKPVAFDLAEAKALRALVAKTGKVFVLTHNYTGNAMVQQARQLVRARKLLSGECKVVHFWRIGIRLFFGGSSSPEKAKSTSSVSGFSSF